MYNFFFTEGHDSIQDAVCSLELAFLKVWQHSSRLVKNYLIFFLQVKRMASKEENKYRLASNSCEDEPPWMESLLPKQSIFEKLVQQLATAENLKVDLTISNGIESTPSTSKVIIGQRICWSIYPIFCNYRNARVRLILTIRIKKSNLKLKRVRLLHLLSLKCLYALDSWISQLSIAGKIFHLDIGFTIWFLISFMPLVACICRSCSDPVVALKCLEESVIESISLVCLVRSIIYILYYSCLECV